MFKKKKSEGVTGSNEEANSSDTRKKNTGGSEESDVLIDGDPAELANKESVPQNADDESQLQRSSSGSTRIVIKESWRTILCQTSFPIFSAGLGMVCAGVLLNYVQNWRVFSNVPEFMILTTPLLGLKGDLEMTLASRMSTSANLGHITPQNRWTYFGKDICLTQIQAVVVGLMAALVSMLLGLTYGYSQQGGGAVHAIDSQMAYVLVASSIATASAASMVLGALMFTVVIVSKNLNVNPDNISTPLAGVLGDVTTLMLLAFIGEFLYEIGDDLPWLSPAMIGLSILINPFLLWISYKTAYTRSILLTGWTPIIASMFLSSLSGLIFQNAQNDFSNFGTFQTIINGVGGNMAAVQASRVSTTFHRTCDVGELPPNLRGIRKKLNPCVTFCQSGQDSVSAWVLLCMLVPGQVLFLTFAYVISLLVSPNSIIYPYHPVFLVMYLVAAVVQTSILLYCGQIIISLMWERKLDPDTNTIPYLTGLGDLFGSSLLFIVQIVSR